MEQSQFALSVKPVTPVLPLNHHPTKQINASLPFSSSILCLPTLIAYEQLILA